MSEPKNKHEKVEEELEKEGQADLEEVEVEEQEQEKAATEAAIDPKDAEINELKAELEKQENRYLRQQADFENIKKRHIAEREAIQKYRSQSLAQDLLPALDSFEKALESANETAETKALLAGMEMVYKQILQAFEKEGIVPIEAVGEQFDPNFHQAVMQDSDENAESNSITAELQKGYKLKDRVIRPSMVKVNQ